MNIKMQNILCWSVTGDTLGTPLDGMPRAHIHAVFGGIEGYVDPSPALKGKMARWKKPGLYSSITQLQLLAAAAMKEGRLDLESFLKLVKETPASAGSDTCIFRYPDTAESSIILSGIDTIESCTKNAISARLLPLAVGPALKTPAAGAAILETVRLFKAFTADPVTVSGGMILTVLAMSLGSGNDASPKNIIRDSLAVIEDHLMILTTSPHLFFDLGLNPNSLLSAINLYRKALAKALEGKTINEAEKAIVTVVNSVLKTPCTRATINHPLAILPLALLLVYHLHDDPELLLFRAAQEGGSCAALTAVTGILAGCYFDFDVIPPGLKQGLVNRRNLLGFIDAISSGRTRGELVKNFIQTEASLTEKMHEELKAKLKHVKGPGEKKKTARNREEELARHVVESWTKIDRARYKKERRKKP